MKSFQSGGFRFRSEVALLGLAMALTFAGDAWAQDPQRPPDPSADTVPAADTAPVVADSLDVEIPREAAADTLEPIEVVPRMSGGAEPSWRAGIWEWDRDALQASGAITLTDLLERIPGVQAIRYGLFGQPEGVSAWGLAGGGTEVILDGFVLDPLDAGTHDLSRIELAELERVRVERTAGRMRVELETISPSDPRPFSMIEAGMGQPDKSKMIRGIFQTPRFLGGPFSVALDRVDSEGFNRGEPANTFAGWLKWGRVSGSTALQFEYRQHNLERALPDGTLGDGSRRDWVLRARGTPLKGLTTEAYFGMSSLDEQLGADRTAMADGTAAGDDDDSDAGPERMEIQSAQAGLRAAYWSELGWSRASVRLRNQQGLPAVETELSGGLTALGPLHLSGTVGWSDWRDGASAVAWGAKAELGALFGFRPFAELSGGRRGVPFLQDSTGAAVLTDRASLRIGSDFQWKGLHLGGAFVAQSADSVAAFGLPFDHTVGLVPGGDMRGWEFTGRIPLLWEPLSLEGSYVRWISPAPWLYTPKESLRAALVYSHSPLPSGNLEILARVEGRHQGAMTAPTLEGTTSLVEPYTAFDAYLHLRILDVRIFVHWENLLMTPDIQYLPERAFPRQRVFYGVKWHFWN